MIAPIWIIFGVFMLISWLISYRLKSKFKQYSKVPINNGLTGSEVAEKMLHDNGIFDVKVVSTPGMLTDHYNPATKPVNLSEAVYGNSSVAAAAVAAHECGHAVQHAKACAFLQMRSALVPVVSIASRWVQWILLAGVLLVQTFPGVLLAGIILLMQGSLAHEQLSKLLKARRAELRQQIADGQEQLKRLEARLQQIEADGSMPKYEIVVKDVDPLWVASVSALLPSYEEAERVFDRLFNEVESTFGGLDCLIHNAASRCNRPATEQPEATEDLRLVAAEHVCEDGSVAVRKRRPTHVEQRRQRNDNRSHAQVDDW